MKSHVSRLAVSLLAGALAASAFANATQAADLNGGRVSAYPDHTIPRTAGWTGAYLGANLGYGWSRVSGEFDAFALKGDGIVGGFHAGYNHQIRNFVLGVEGDFNWSDVRARELVGTFGAIDTHHRNLGSIRGRLGFAFDRLLAYGTVGYGWTDVRISATDGITTASRTDTTGGVVWGGGLEYKLQPNISVRAEALRYETSGHFHAVDGSRVRIDTPVTEVRAGLTWHVNLFR